MYDISFYDEGIQNNTDMYTTFTGRESQWESLSIANHEQRLWRDIMTIVILQKNLIKYT